MFLEHAQTLLDGALELRIVAGDDLLRPVLYIYVRRDAFVLDRPFTIAIEEAAARCDHRAAIDKGRRVGRVNEAAPRAFADKQPDLAPLAHVRRQIAARARHLVDDHHLRPPDAGRRTGERIAVAGDVVEIAVE